jgi:5-(carboxyamino)imidazole ribonucleotide mutase
MPPGVPVATVAINGSRNSGILAAQVIGASDQAIADRLAQFKEKMRKKVEALADEVEDKGYKAML